MVAQPGPGEALRKGPNHGTMAGRESTAGGCRTAAMRDAVSAAVGCKLFLALCKAFLHARLGQQAWLWNASELSRHDPAGRTHFCGSIRMRCALTSRYINSNKIETNLLAFLSQTTGTRAIANRCCYILGLCDWTNYFDQTFDCHGRRDMVASTYEQLFLCDR